MPKKKGTRYYRATFYLGGRQHSASSTKSQKDAERKAAIKKDKMERGEIGISGKMTVARWATEWAETYKKPIVNRKQYDEYVRIIKKTIIPAIGKLYLTEVNDAQLQKIMNAFQGKSTSKAKRVRNTLRAIFRMARGSRLITYDPAEFIVLPQTTEGTHRSITDYEREHFLGAAKTHHGGLMFKVMLYCGLRTGEVVALDWRHIDFKRRRITIESAMESGSTRIKGPKTKAGERQVPIPDEIYDELLAQKGDPFEPVFTRVKAGDRHTETSRRQAWDSLKKQIDISMGAVYEKRKARDGKMRAALVLSVVAPDFVPYCLRHTYCTDLQDKGVPINIAKYLMGHSDIRVTSNIYTHITEDAIEVAARLINNANNNAKNIDRAQKA